MNEKLEYNEIIKKINFHDAEIINFTYDQNDLVIDIKDGWLNYIKWTIRFIDANVVGNDLEKGYSIDKCDYRMLPSNRYCLRLDNIEIVANKILVNKDYVSLMMAKYIYGTDIYRENIESIKECFSNRLLDFIENNVDFMSTKIRKYKFESDNLTIDYIFKKKNLSITFHDIDVKLYDNYIQKDIKEIDNILEIVNKKDDDLRNSIIANLSNCQIENVSVQIDEIFKYYSNHPLSVRKIEDGYECAILLLYDQEHECEVRFRCSNITYR